MSVKPKLVVWLQAHTSESDLHAMHHLNWCLYPCKRTKQVCLGHTRVAHVLESVTVIVIVMQLRKHSTLGYYAHLTQQLGQLLMRLLQILALLLPASPAASQLHS